MVLLEAFGLASKAQASAYSFSLCLKSYQEGIGLIRQWDYVLLGGGSNLQVPLLLVLARLVKWEPGGG